MTIKIPASLINIVTHKFEVTIPRIIHQTYKSIEQLPEVWKDTPETWKQTNPEWKYIFWSDKDCRKLVKEKYPWFLRTYDSYEYAIQRADAIRPMIMHTYGGIYADCDIQALKSFDDLFLHNHDIYLIKTPNIDIVTNCIMASKPGISFWIKVLEEMVIREDNPSLFWIGKHWYVMCTTGPIMLSAVFTQYKNIYNFSLLPRDFLLPCNICTDKPCSTINSYTRLVEGSSWVEWDTHFYNMILCNYHKIIMLIITSLILYSIYIVLYYST